MASNLLAMMASNLIAMASNLEAMASKLKAMASDLDHVKAKATKTICGRNSVCPLADLCWRCLRCLLQPGESYHHSLSVLTLLGRLLATGPGLWTFVDEIQKWMKSRDILG